MHGIFLNKNLVFIDSTQFMNSSLDKLVKNLSDEDFKYLGEDENLELLKQKGVDQFVNSFDLKKKNCLLENIFTAL